MDEAATGTLTRIGFVGLGKMGWPMASLLAPHYALTVLDVRAEAADSFAAEHGATAAADLRTLGAASDTIITMLPDGEVVREVALGGADGEGLAAGLARGSVLIDMSSSAPLGTRRLAEELRERSIKLVDAPVSGGVTRARDGSLAIMAGGDVETIARCRPLLERLGRTIYEMGAVGAGHTMKALNNYLAATGMAAACEALIVGDRMGLDPARMIEVLNASSGRNSATEGKAAQEVLSRGFASGFTMGLMAKDVGIAAGIAEELALETPLLARCRELWRGAEEQLGRAVDHTEVVRLWEMWNGRELGAGGEQPS